jgi:hypothetical protein
MTVSIEQGVSQADPTYTSRIVFDVLFSKSVSDFDSSDVIITSTSGEALKGVVHGSIPGRRYTVSVDVTLSGTIDASIAAGAASGNGQTNLASTSVDNQVVFQNKLIDDVAAIEVKLDDESQCKSDERNALLVGWVGWWRIDN